MIKLGQSKKWYNVVMKLRVAVFAGLFAGAVWASEKPNVIFLLCDDLGYADVGYMQKYRATRAIKIETPNLDRLAAEGTILTDHYCAAPVCAPSRASILTGRLQTEGGCSLRNNAFDKPIAETETLGTVMQAAGYETYAVGKWGIGGGGESGQPVLAHPLDRGFDHYYGFMDHRAGHTYYHWDGFWGRAYMGVWEGKTKATETAVGRYSTDLFIARAKKYIEDQLKDDEKKDKPFFMYLAINTIHGSGQGQLNPTLPQGQKQNLHVPGGAYVASTAADGSVIWPIPEEPEATRNTFTYPQYAALPNEAAKRYATGITRLDEAMGDLVAFLKAKKIYRNTIIIFTSDNGPAAEYGANPSFFESTGPFYGYKRDVYEGGLRVPAFVSWPAKKAKMKRVNTAPSISVDWMTALKALGENPTRVPIPVSKKLVSEYYFGANGETDGTFDGAPSLTRYRHGDQRWEREGDTVRVRVGGKDKPTYVFSNINADKKQQRPGQIVPSGSR